VREAKARRVGLAELAPPGELSGWTDLYSGPLAFSFRNVQFCSVFGNGTPPTLFCTQSVLILYRFCRPGRDMSGEDCDIPTDGDAKSKSKIKTATQ
jgi:hypothetical protein